jgi:isoquinoline 1-oxidoreductase subunit beta
MVLDHLTRRRFLQAGAAARGGLLLSLSLPSANGNAEAADADGFAPNAFIRIQGDEQIVLTMPYVEMGQGTYTSIPMLIAELEVDLMQVRLEHAPPNEKLYGNPLLGGLQATGNSNAIRASWQPLRQTGAIARTKLISAAAQRWNVDPASCRTQSGEVLHPPTGRSLKYGDLAADAAHMPVPESVTLKRPADFKLIGTPAKRLDAPGQRNGRLRHRSAARRRRRGSCRPHGRCKEGAGGTGDRMGRQAARLRLNTQEIVGELEKATLNSGPVAQNIGNSDAVMASVATKVEATYEVPFLAHATMEPMNCTSSAQG